MASPAKVVLGSEQLHAVEDRLAALEPSYGVGIDVSWCSSQAVVIQGASGNSTVTVTALVNGFQSSRGLSMTAAGMVWVTIRSMSWMMVRCLAIPPFSA